MIMIEHIGYKTQHISINNNHSLVIKLEKKPIASPDISVLGNFSLPAQQVSSSVTRITENEIEMHGLRNIEQSVAGESAIVINRTGDGRETISIRGSNSNEVGVFVDGVLINTPFYSNADLSSINLFDISRIEIIKGGSSTLFGSGYFGGVVNLHSRDAERSNLTMRYAGSTVFNNDSDFYIKGTLALRKFGASYRTTKKVRPLTIDNLYKNEYNTLSMQYSDENFKTQFKVFDQKYSVSAENNSFVLDSTLQVSAQFLGNIPILGKDWQATITYREDQNSDSFWEMNTQRQSSKDQAGGIKILKSFLWKSISTTLLVEHKTDDFFGSSQYTIPDYYLRNTDLTVDQERSAAAGIFKLHSTNLPSQFEEITLEAGLRYEYIYTGMTRYDDHDVTTDPDQCRIDTTFESFSNRFITKKIGIRANGSTGDWTYDLFTNFSKDFRTAILRDIFNIETTPIYAYRGKELLPEVLSAYEFGLETEHSLLDGLQTKIQFSINVFRNQYYNKSYYIQPPGSPPIPVQTDNAQITGSDIGAGLSFLNDIIQLNYLRTRLYLSDARTFPGKPAIRYTAGMDLNLYDFNIYYNYYYEGKQYLTNGEMDMINKLENASLTVNYSTLLKKIKLNLSYRIDNLMSEKGALPDDFQMYMPAKYFSRYNEVIMLQLTYSR